MLNVGLIYNLKKKAIVDAGTGSYSKVDGIAKSVSTKNSSVNKTWRKNNSARSLKIKGNFSEDRYLEWDEPSTIKAIKDVLSENYRVILLEADKTLGSKLKRYKKELDVVFNLAEGLHGAWREAIVPLMLEELGVPYTGSDPTTLVLCLDKERTKQILTYHKVKCPTYKVFTEVPELTEKEIAPLECPLIVKPLYEGSSKGIKNNSLVMGVKDCQNQIARIIQTYKQPVLVEEFIPGREFTVGILGNGEDILVLPIVELNFAALPKGATPIYSYEAKWIWDVPEKPLDMFHCPAEIYSSVERRIKETAVNAYNALGCRDWCRVDIRLDNLDKPYVLELNPIPGILPDANQNSCLPKAARAYGWNYSQLINNVLSITCKRYGIKYENACSSSI